MNATVIEMSPIHVLMLRHTGPYDQLGPVFEQLWDWVSAHGVPAERTIGIYYDNPDYVPAGQLRSAACVAVPSFYQYVDRGGLRVSDEQIAGGTYVTTRFVGPYEDLAPVWSELTQYIEGTLKRRISDNPAFEVYVNDASTTPPNELITELYMPIT